MSVLITQSDKEHALMNLTALGLCGGCAPGQSSVQHSVYLLLGFTEINLEMSPGVLYSHLLFNHKCVKMIPVQYAR